jgi:hypothetical protein
MGCGAVWTPIPPTGNAAHLLILAANEGSLQTFKTLLAISPDSNVKSAYVATARARNRNDIAELLIKTGAQ